MTSLPPPLSELEARLGVEAGSLTGVDKARAERVISDATALALAEVSDVTATGWSADPPEGTGAPAVVVTVILKAARREFDNPENFSTESLADYAYSVSASGVYLTAREAAIIRRAATGRTSTGFVGSVRVRSSFENI